MTQVGGREMANPWGASSASRARACAVAWGLTGTICLSLCPRRRCPHHLLLQLPAAHHPTEPPHLCLHHQQQLPQPGSDVSTHGCRGLGLCWPGQCPEWGREGDEDVAGDTRSTASGSQHGRCAAPAGRTNIAFLPAAWSPRRRRSCARTPGRPGCRHT